MRTAIRFALLALTLTPALPTRAPAQSRPTQHEIVRGRITGDSSRAVSGATVVVTRVSDRQCARVHARKPAGPGGLSGQIVDAITS